MYEFNNDKREITFDKYNTPTPWMNYLSNGTFHTMISQAGGGVAFYKSPQIWRINHYRFFHLPTDRSGFYTYIKDGADFWCPTNEPCKSKPEKWRSTHGMGYTRFNAEKNGIKAEVTYFVGKYENALIWNIRLASDSDKKVILFPYVELGMMEFMRELQWQCYNKHQLTCYNMGDILVYKYGVENQPKPDETPLVYFVANVPAAAFDCDRDEFVGSYRSEENPQNVEKGACTNSNMYGGDPCFALQLDVDLKAGVEKEINIFLGTAMTEDDIKKSAAHCRETDFVKESFSALAKQWDEYLSHFQCEIPDKDAQTMINIWNPYQAERNFQFSRNISYYATGTFRGVGVRDTAQDILAMVPFDIRRAKDKLNLLFTQQYKDGHCNHYCFPTEGWEPVTRIHSDNHLWLVMACYHIVMEEGKLDYLDETVEYYDGESATVWEHIKKSIDFCMANRGEYGFPLMLASDWNDMLYKVCREGKGESIWTSMQFGTVLRMIAEIADLKGEDGKKYLDIYEEQKKLVNEIAWDGGWYRRCITDDGTFIGSEKEPQAKIWLNTQSWAVISGMGDNGEMAMDNVKKYLDTDLGVKKIHPSMTTDYPTKDGNLTMYNKGCGENGSVFCHANTWAIIAECILKRPENAYKYYHQLLPMIAQQKAGEWRYKAEPYVYASNIFGPESDKFGLANVSWLTGTAAYSFAHGYNSMVLGRPLKALSLDTTKRSIVIDSSYSLSGITAGKKIVLRFLDYNDSQILVETKIKSVSGKNIYLNDDVYLGDDYYSYQLFPDGIIFAIDTSTSYANASESGGYNTIASGKFTTANGYYTIAGAEGANIWGKYGLITEPYSLALANGIAATTPGLAFMVLANGSVHADSEYTTPCADYAEFFEWDDGNENAEDRTGYFVKLVGEKITKCDEFDEPLGIVSATPAIVGDSGELHWKDKFVTDDFGRIQYHDVIVPEEKDEEGNIIIEEHIETQPILNPEWNSKEVYIPRKERREWSEVGVLGKLIVYDDGTLNPGDICRTGRGGIAVKSITNGYPVLKRISENKILIWFRG